MVSQSENQSFESFDSFWPFYLSQHSTAQCRLYHFLGTASASTFIWVCLLSLRLGWLLWALIVGYGFAWWGHWAYEKNQPATFQYPLYSFLGDWKMFWMMMRGTLSDEFKRLQIELQS